MIKIICKFRASTSSKVVTKLNLNDLICWGELFLRVVSSFLVLSYNCFGSWLDLFSDRHFGRETDRKGRVEETEIVQCAFIG